MKRSKLLIGLLMLGLVTVAVLVGATVMKPALKKTAERIAEQQQKREEYKKFAAGRTAAELISERKWEEAAETPCAGFGRGSAPQLCIEHLGPDSAAIGTPVTYRVRWRNLPDRAYIRVWSRNAALAGKRWAYMGPQGAIAQQSLGDAPAGDVRAIWDGRSIYCAPADAPMMCDAGEVGRYVLRAAIMTGSDPFWPSWPPMNPVPVVRHARSETRPFTLHGPPQPVTVPASFRSHPARAEIVDAIRAALPEGALGTDWYVQRRIDRLQPWVAKSRDYCARLELDAPLEGSVSVCFPQARRDTNGIALRPGDIVAHSQARLVKGLLRADDAKAKASAYAIRMTGGRTRFSTYPTEQELVRVLHPDRKTYDGSYQGLRNGARDAGLTFVDVNQPWPSFRQEPGGSWWLVELGLSIQTIDGPRVRDWGRLALRVDHNGHVCRVDPTGEREGSGPDERIVYTPCRPGSRMRF
jgi:hypothetical protein